MIFYFTGTGNSLYVAKYLDYEIVSIPHVIGEFHTYNSEKIGIVCPIYSHEIPAIVKEFIKKNRFITNYFFMVLTYGYRHGGAAEMADMFLRKNGVSANYINTILMVDNFLPLFDMAEEIKKDKKVEEQLKKIKWDINSEICEVQAATPKDRAHHRKMLEQGNYMAQKGNLYAVTDACIGCGVCTEVCPMGCIQIQEGKAVYDSSGCQKCMACVHHCTQKAIRFLVPDKNPIVRYRNKHITLQEIIAANRREE